jgi:hypothetical protein
MGNVTFQQNRSLRSVTLGSGLTEIPGQAFYNNFGAGISEITFSSSTNLKTIKGSAFVGAKWKSLIVPNGVETIEGAAFGSNGYLIDLRLPLSMISLDDAALVGTTQLTKVCYLGTNTAVLEAIIANGKTVGCVTTPAAPTIGAVSRGNNQISVAFTAGADNGNAISNYEYSTDGTTYTPFGPADVTSPLVVTGLTSGTEYTIRIKAVNGLGAGSASAAVTGTPLITYSSNSGEISCGTSGYFTVANNIITGNTACTGAVLVPNGITSIADYSFDGSQITSINIPNTVTYIGLAAFNASTNLATVTFESESTLLTVNGSAFAQTAITSIVLPNSITYMGNYVFYAAVNLVNITLPNRLTAIFKHTFDGCTSLVELVIPDSVVLFDTDAFINTPALTSVTYHGSASITELSASGINVSSVIISPISTANITITAPMTDGTPVESLSTNGQFTTSITWSEAPTTFAPSTVYTATVTVTPVTGYTLTGVTANFFTVNGQAATSANLVDAGVFTYQFAATLALPVVVSFDCAAGGGTYQVYIGVLTGTTGLCSGDLVLDNSITEIEYASLFNTKITSLTIPASVLTITNPLYYVKELVSIYVDSASTTFKAIDGVLFDYAGTTLISYPASKPGSTYEIPNSVTDIGIYAFESNKFLTSITIPDGVVYMQGVTFFEAQALTTVNIGSGLAILAGGQDFAWIKTLTAINVDAANTSFASIDGVLYNKAISTLLSYPAGKAGTSYTSPSTVTSTAYTVFGGVINLLTADLSSVSTLASQAFMDATSIQEVIFGDSLTVLSYQTFQSASALRKVTFGSGLTLIQEGAFYANDRLYCVIYPGSEAFIQNYTYGNGIVPVSSSSDCLANPAITLSTSTIMGTVGSPVNTYTISSTGGAVAEYSISPDISSIPGLSFSSSTGIISGTPLYASAAQTFTVTATNLADITTRTFTLSVRLKPIPYLTSITKPKMNLKDGAYMCSAGTYEFGYTIGGVVDASVSGLVIPDKYTFTLLINGVADSALTVTTTKEINVWSITQPASGSLISCGVSVTVNSLSTGALSTENTDGVAAAQSLQSAGLKAAEASYKAAAKAIPLAYQKSLVDNRAAWRKVIDAIRANYAVVIDRIKTGGGSKIISDVATASEVTSAAKMKANDDYAASKSAARVTADKATKAATEARALAIAKAKATYGTYIESIGHGVLIP